MRQDIAKVLCERPRLGGDNHNKGGRTKNKSFDDLPSKESMRGKHVRNYSGKVLNEYLAPLRRFVETTEGRNWDEVYSEIRALIKPGNAVMEHILEHLEQYVTIKVVRDDSAPYGLVGHYVLSSRSRGFRFNIQPGDLYVDPDTKIIKRLVAAAKQKKEEKPKKFHKFNDQFVWNENGIWYSGSLKKFEKITKAVPSYGQNSLTYRNFYIVDGTEMDHLTDRSILRSLGYASYYTDESIRRMAFGGEDITLIGKKQLNKAELKKFGLK